MTNVVLMPSRDRDSNKLDMLVAMLRRPQGVTNEEALAALGWRAVSLPQQAERAGIGLCKKIVNGETRYFATDTPKTSTGSMVKLRHAHQKAIDLLQRRPQTADELEAAGCDHRRVSDLVAWGYAVATGDRRPTRTGGMADILRYEENAKPLRRRNKRPSDAVLDRAILKMIDDGSIASLIRKWAKDQQLAERERKALELVQPLINRNFGSMTRRFIDEKTESD